MGLRTKHICLETSGVEHGNRRVNSGYPLFNKLLGISNIARIDDISLSLIRVGDPTCGCVYSNSSNIRRAPREDGEAIEKLRTVVDIALELKPHTFLRG